MAGESGRRSDSVPTRSKTILSRGGETGRGRFCVELFGMRRDIGWTRRGPRTEVDTSQSNRLRNRAEKLVLVVFDGFLELFQDLQVILACWKLYRTRSWR